MSVSGISKWTPKKSGSRKSKNSKKTQNDVKNELKKLEIEKS